MRSITKFLIVGIISMQALVAFADDGHRGSYESKIKQVDDTIVTIDGMIRKICLGAISALKASCASKKIPKVLVDEIYKYITDDEKPVENRKSTEQLVDAIEQFNQHYEFRAKAKELAVKGQYKDAFLREEFAYQYLIKAATRAVFANKMLTGDIPQDL